MGKTIKILAGTIIMCMSGVSAKGIADSIGGRVSSDNSFHVMTSGIQMENFNRQIDALHDITPEQKQYLKMQLWVEMQRQERVARERVQYVGIPVFF